MWLIKMHASAVDSYYSRHAHHVNINGILVVIAIFMHRHSLHYARPFSRPVGSYCIRRITHAQIIQSLRQATCIITLVVQKATKAGRMASARQYKVANGYVYD